MNDKGPCGTTGSLEGDSVQELLDKYYAYNYTDLKVTEFTVDLSLIGSTSNSNIAFEILI
jgi:hypothetical protein